MLGPWCLFLEATNDVLPLAVVEIETGVQVESVIGIELGHETLHRHFTLKLGPLEVQSVGFEVSSCGD